MTAMAYSRVLGVSTRSARDHLEQRQTIHMCKVVACQGGEGLHCTSYDAVDAEALVDLGAYGKVSAWRIGVLALPGLYSLTGFSPPFVVLVEDAVDSQDDLRPKSLGKSMTKVY